MMVEEDDDAAAALGFVSPHGDAGFGRGAAERQRPALARCACGSTSPNPCPQPQHRLARAPLRDGAPCSPGTLMTCASSPPCF